MLQVVKGYCIEFTNAPFQSQIPPEIHTSAEIQSQVVEEIKDLLNKGAIEEVQPDQGSFISQLFLVKKKGRIERLIKPVHQSRALQDGRTPSTSFPSATGRLDGEVGLERCLSSGSNSSTLSPVSTVPMAGTTYQFKHFFFGFSVARRVFTKLLKQVVGLLRQSRSRLIMYLDNLLSFTSPRKHWRLW